MQLSGRANLSGWRWIFVVSLSFAPRCMASHTIVLTGCSLRRSRHFDLCARLRGLSFHRRLPGALPKSWRFLTQERPTSWSRVSSTTAMMSRQFLPPRLVPASRSRQQGLGLRLALPAHHHQHVCDRLLPAHYPSRWAAFSIHISSVPGGSPHMWPLPLS